MKKQGFTLAEVLITLGIVGVVAALTAPALIQNASMAKVGPSLKKAVAAMETAHEQLMQEEEISDLASLGNGYKGFNYGNKDEGDLGASDLTPYLNKLTEQLQGSSYEYKQMKTASGSNNKIFTPTLKNYSGTEMKQPGAWILHLNTGADVVFMNGGYGYPGKDSLIGGFVDIYVDINGAKTKPNTVGKDVFRFYIDRSGIVVPIGGNLYSSVTGYKKYTDTGSKCDKTGVNGGATCAGSIFDNNLKVIYK